jgi:uncharacterized protein with NRDE domain
MCVLAFAWDHPRWRLVVAGNRDEFHARPSAPLAEWSDAPGLMAGRDLVSGGTWLGVHRGGRFAVVTNVRGQPPRPDARSRGDLVAAALTGAPLPVNLDAFNGFNLIVVDGNGARFVTNRPRAGAQPLAPGVYGLANAGLDEPWPKTVRLKTVLADWLAGTDQPEALFDGLAEEVPEDHGLASIFIRNPVYGTRCSTIVAVGQDGGGIIAERRFDSDGAITGETRIPFDWPI